MMGVVKNTKTGENTYSESSTRTLYASAVNENRLNSVVKNTQKGVD